MIFGREVLVDFGLFIEISSKKQYPFSVKSNIFPFYIWSEYGDEITVDKEPKLVRWNPTQKKIAQRVTMANEKQHNIKKTIEIKRWGTIFPSCEKMLFEHTRQLKHQATHTFKM